MRGEARGEAAREAGTPAWMRASLRKRGRWEDGAVGEEGEAMDQASGAARGGRDEERALREREGEIERREWRRKGGEQGAG